MSTLIIVGSQESISAYCKESTYTSVYIHVSFPKDVSKYGLARKNTS